MLDVYVSISNHPRKQPRKRQRRNATLCKLLIRIQMQIYVTTVYVAKFNHDLRHHGGAAAMLDLIVGQEADWRAAHDYRPLNDLW